MLVRPPSLHWSALAAADASPVPPGFVLFAVVALAVMAGWMHAIYRRRTHELAESEERFRQLFDHALEGVYETRERGGFLRVNPAMARILGYREPAEVLAIPAGKIAQLYCSPSRRDEFFTALGSRDQLANFESEIRRPDGSIAWIEENVRAVRDRAGRVLYLQGFASDITARKRAEAAVRASAERFRVLFEHSPIGVVEYDYRATVEWLAELRTRGVVDFAAWLESNPDELRAADQRVAIVGANAAALRLFGVRNLAEGLANLNRFYTADVYAARRHTFLTMWNGGTEADGEFSVTSYDGRALRIYYRWRVPVIEQRPFFERTQLALVDLTEVKTTELALAAERERLRVTLRAMTEGVITTDPAGVVQFMNDAAGEMTGWLPGAAIGHAFSEVCRLVNEKREAGATPVESALAAGRPIDLAAETALQPRAGGTRRIEGRCAPMHDSAALPIGAVFVFRDVTERQRLEGELLRASKLESVGVLAGGIAHDFNNLLTIVMGNVTLALLDERTKFAGGSWLREAERATLRAKELTQQLLTFATGGQPLRATVSLADVVREAIGSALPRGCCELDVAPDLRPADVDRGQIGQAVQNLLVNAGEATSAGGEIRLRLANETLADHAVARLAAGDYVRLEISDTGPGIAADHLPHVFEPFFTTKESGKGLGLATVYSVVQKHRGHITVESLPGHGTTFRLWLPAAPAGAAAAIDAAQPFTPLAGRVLFMDDEEPIRVMTKMLLERIGLQVEVASEGSVAVREYVLARMAGSPFHLVIMDLTVPGGMGGAEAMREILKVDPDARGIVSSGYSSDPVMANYRAHGFRGMVPKPYRIADFSRTIRQVLEHGQMM